MTSLGREGRDDDAYIYNDVKLWNTWDHFPDLLGRRECRHFCTQKEDEEVDRMEAEDRFDEELARIPKTIEIAAGEVAHHTNAERTLFKSTPGE